MIGEIHFPIALILKLPGNGRSFGVIEFTTQGVKGDFLHGVAKVLSPGFFARLHISCWLFVVGFVGGEIVGKLLACRSRVVYIQVP